MMLMTMTRSTGVFHKVPPPDGRRRRGAAGRTTTTTITTMLLSMPTAALGDVRRYGGTSNMEVVRPQSDLLTSCKHDV
jgi:hypothetical protein